MQEVCCLWSVVLGVSPAWAVDVTLMLRKAGDRAEGHSERVPWFVHCGSVRCVGERAYVDVPFAEKDEAKRLGARWDMAERRWYAPPGREPGLSRWAPAAPLPAVLPGEDRTFGSGLFVDLIPASCWFTNVRSCVSARDWDRLRTLVYGRVGNRCEACGAGVHREHQVWLKRTSGGTTTTPPARSS